MKTFDITIFSCDGTTDINGDMNAVKSSFTHDSPDMLGVLDHLKTFLLAATIANHQLSIEIDTL